LSFDRTVLEMHVLLLWNISMRTSLAYLFLVVSAICH
jgi:hypothetical protein